MPNLILSSSKEVFEIVIPKCNIGRADCEITIPDASISRNHAQIAQTQDGGFCLSDLGSTNGTFINGKKLKENTYYKLAIGDELTFGDIKVVFEDNTSDSNNLIGSFEKVDNSNSNQIISTNKNTQINKNHNTHTNKNTNFVYAGFLQRFVAHLIDGGILSIAGGILYFICILLFKGNGVLLYAPLSILGVWLYSAKTVSSAEGATFGKKCMGIKVVNLEGQTISFGRATGRYFASYLSGFIFFLGYLIQLCNQRRQTLHDIIVKTIVVKV